MIRYVQLPLSRRCSAPCVCEGLKTRCNPQQANLFHSLLLTQSIPCGNRGGIDTQAFSQMTSTSTEPLDQSSAASLVCIKSPHPRVPIKNASPYSSPHILLHQLLVQRRTKSLLIWSRTNYYVTSSCILISHNNTTRLQAKWASRSVC
jgi:hypothetical protein